MIDFKPTDGGARRIVCATCEYCRAVDMGIVQTKPAIGDYADPWTDLTKLGWIQRDGKSYCGRSCADRNDYDNLRKVEQVAVTKLNDVGYKPTRTAPVDPTKRNAPKVAPRVSG